MRIASPLNIGQEHVVESENLIAQHGQTVEHVRPLVVLDTRDGRLQPGDVGFERNCKSLAETGVQVARRPTWPTSRRRTRMPSPTPAMTRTVRCGSAGVPKSVRQQTEPQREQGVG